MRPGRFNQLGSTHRWFCKLTRVRCATPGYIVGPLRTPSHNACLAGACLAGVTHFSRVRRKLASSSHDTDTRSSDEQLGTVSFVDNTSRYQSLHNSALLLSLNSKMQQAGLPRLIVGQLVGQKMAIPGNPRRQASETAKIKKVRLTKENKAQMRFWRPVATLGKMRKIGRAGLEPATKGL
jgi:hypothetical protein